MGVGKELKKRREKEASYRDRFQSVSSLPEKPARDDLNKNAQIWSSSEMG